MALDILYALEAINVDVQGALRRFAENERFLRQFPQDENFQKLSQAMSDGDWDIALNAAHTLKGVSGNLGMNRLYEACSETCRLLRENDLPAAKRSYLELQEAYQQLISALVNFRENV